MTPGRILARIWEDTKLLAPVSQLMERIRRSEHEYDWERVIPVAEEVERVTGYTRSINRMNNGDATFWLAWMDWWKALPQNEQEDRITMALLASIKGGY